MTIEPASETHRRTGGLSNVLVSSLRGPWALVLVLGSIAYGVVIVAVLPFWSRMAAAAGGTELQERFGYSAAQAREALAGISANAQADALAFYALDVPNAVLYALGLAAMMAFGLRQLHLAGSPLCWLLGLPLVAGLADLAENAVLASALLLWPDVADPQLAAAGVLTSLKLGAGLLSQVIAVVLVLSGLAAMIRRRRRAR